MCHEEAFSHCLRPVFTKLLVQKIKCDFSLNLIGEHGLGRRRTLDDVQQCLGDEVRVLRINLKFYKESYTAFLKELGRQLDVQTEKATSLTDLFTKVECLNKPVLVLLHNFDAILNNPKLDPAFDSSFFDHLNSIRNQKNMSLICVTVKAHDQSLVLIDGQPHSYSWLDLQQLVLPALSQKELKADLRRRKLKLGVEQ